MPDLPPGEENYTPDCQSQSPYFENSLKNLPSLAADPLTVKVNLIIMQKNDGTGNFQDIPEHRDFINEAVGWANSRMGDVVTNYAPCQSPDNRTDTKIQYDVNLVFYPDPTPDNFFWNRDNCNTGGSCCPNTTTWWLNPIDDIIHADPNIPPGINYFLTTSETQMNEILDENGDCIATVGPGGTALPDDGSCGQWPTLNNFNQSSKVHGPNYWLTYAYRQSCAEITNRPFSETRNWLLGTFSYYLRHEIGHNYEESHRCFVGPTCNGTNLMTGTNTNCNVLGSRTYLDNGQIGNMHNSLATTNLRQFVCCDETYGVPRLVESDETWDFDQRLYQDVIVQSGATLRLTCNHLMPKDGKIIVERGARLVIDGATVSRANTCGGEEKWDGIYLIGNNDKGHDPSMLDENAPLEPDNPAILIIKNNATIEYATRAIQTENSGFGIPYHERVNMRNGLISATDVIFRNNFVTCGFMYDDQFDHTPNLNLSHFTRCDFLNEDGTADFGVVNWRTDNVLFDDCEFNGLNIYGIRAGTAGITVKNSRFYGNGTGVILVADDLLSQPIVIGTVNEPNEFKENGTGIKALGINSLNVSGNSFKNNFHGIFCMGESQFVIQNNGFENNIYSMGLENSGKSYKLSSCNTYESNPFFSLNIYAQGENSGIQFKEETFMTPVYNILLLHAGNIPGKFSPQGANGNARFNYFQHSGTNGRIATSGVTEEFIYWYPTPNGSNDETRPYCTINENNGCSAINKFYSFETDGGNNGCIENGSEGNPEISKGELANLRSEEKNIEGEITNNGTSQELESVLSQVRSDKEFVIAGLIEQWLETANFEEIENMLIAEQTLHSTKKLIGLKLLTQDYASANNLINQLPNSQEVYKRIQSITIDRLTTEAYTLPENDEAFLYLTAEQKIPEAALAQSILILMKGETFAIVPPEIPANTYSQEEEPSEELLSTGMVITPNPARDYIRVEFSDSLEPSERQLTVYNTQGTKMYSVEIIKEETSKFIKVDHLSSGLYYLSLSDKEGNSEIQKFMIQR